MADIVELYFPHVAKSEGAVAHLYLDTKGHLTIGYGHLVFHRDGLAKKNWRTVLKNAADKLWAYQLVSVASRQHNLWNAGGYAPASRQRPPGTQAFIADGDQSTSCKYSENLAPGPWGLNGTGGSEFAEHSRMFFREAEEMLNLRFGKKYRASFYKDFASFEIGSDAAMVRLAKDDIKLKVAEVKKENAFKEFDLFPLSGQFAVLDLAYQGGAHMIAAKYRNGEFGNAVRERRWYDASKLCPGPADGWPPEDRQTLRRSQLIEALRTDQKSDLGNLYQYQQDHTGGQSPEKIG